MWKENQLFKSNHMVKEVRKCRFLCKCTYQMSKYCANLYKIHTQASLSVGINSYQYNVRAYEHFFFLNISCFWNCTIYHSLSTAFLLFSVCPLFVLILPKTFLLDMAVDLVLLFNFWVHWCMKIIGSHSLSVTFARVTTGWSKW